MRITKQTYQNECGVCVINSFYEHFYKESNYLTILNNTQINEDGLSIFEFENTCVHFGLYAESYEIEFDEFVKYKSNHFFVLPLKKNVSMHYVIAYKNKDQFIIYDSCDDKPRQIQINDIKNEFIGILIEIKKFKRNFDFKRCEKIDVLKNIKYSYFFISIFLNVVVVGLSMISANYLNIIINNCINNEVFKYALQITFIFLMIMVLESLVKWILKLFMLKNFKVCFQVLSSNLLISLNNKNKSFINKIDCGNFYFLDASLQTITNFITVEISSLSSNIFMSVVLTCTLIVINPIFLLLCFIVFISTIVFCYFQYVFKKTIFKKSVENQNWNNKISNEYINYFSGQKNRFILTKIHSNLTKNCHSFVKLYVKKQKYDACFNFINEFFHNIVFLICIVVGAYLIIQIKKINLGQLTLLVCLINLLNCSSYGVGSFFMKNIEFKQMIKIYNDFICIDNSTKKGDEKIKFCSSIIINDIELFNGQNITKKQANYLLDNNHQDQVFINNINLSNINSNSYESLLFYLNENSFIKKEWLINEISNNPILTNILKDINLNIFSNKTLTSIEQKKLNLIFLLTLKNKLIIIDECWNIFNSQETNWIMNELIDSITKNNFVLLVK